VEKVLIIGGNAAGLTAASRAKRVDPRLDVTVLEQGAAISYSTCGIPYFLSKLVKPDDLISYTPESFKEERDIQVYANTRVDEISPSRKRVAGTRTDTGERGRVQL
jgi:NADPH-dependent 2,4-dienoyl-CoA reductase/sulfur reductase-like enzyme